MINRIIIFVFIIFASFLFAEKSNSLTSAIDKLRPIHKKLGKPKPGEWLDIKKENGQTFSQYKLCNPRLPTIKRKVIYIQPLGEFSSEQLKIVKLTAEFMEDYFNLPVKIKKELPLSIIPDRAKRKHSWSGEQILSTYILREVLPPRLPRDAAVLIALTPIDLWPGKGWNFVFGQASLKNRVGVFSLYRNGNPAKNEESFLTCLRRTLKTCTHETGHMFSMKHCIKYECNMCGSNSRQESDRRPVVLCPECMAKVCWATKIEPNERYKKLILFCEKNGLKDEADFYKKSQKTISD